MWVIPAGRQQVSFDVTIEGDRSYEFNETYGVLVSDPRFNSAPAQTVTIPNSTAFATIIDDDIPPRVTFLPSPAQIEGDFLNGDPNTPRRTAVNVTVNIDVVAGRPLNLQFNTLNNTTQPGAGTANAGPAHCQ